MKKLIVDLIFMKHRESFPNLELTKAQKRRIYQKCQKRCKRMGLKGSDYQQALEQLIFEELWKLVHPTEQIKKEMPEDAVLDTVTKERRLRRISSRVFDIWDENEPQKEEFPKTMQDSLSHICSKCHSNPCRCPE